MQVSGARCEGDYHALAAAAAASEAAAPTAASMLIARGCFRAPLDVGKVKFTGLTKFRKLAQKFDCESL